MSLIEEKTVAKAAPKLDNDKFNQQVDKCLSMIYHYPEVEQIGAIIKKIMAERLAAKAG